jgi:amino acid adenylation domain-containing protein
MHGTIEDAARQELIRRLGAGENKAASTIGPRSAGTPPPMSVEQRHIWLHAEAAADEPIYNEPITIRYHGKFDHRAFLNAFDELLRRHEALRTSFARLDGDPVQVVHDRVHADFPLIDLGDLTPADRETEALAMAEADARRPIALDKAPLFRGRLVRIADDDHRLYITLHHIIFDGASMYHVLVPELVALYESYAAGREPALDPPPVQYGDYAIWQRQNARDGEFDAQLAYWRGILAEPPPMLDLPAGRPTRPIDGARGALAAFRLEAALVERLTALGRRRGATLYMTLLAAFNVLLHRYSGQEDMIIGGIADTRRRPELARMAGYCLNLVPLRSRPAPDMPFTAFLDQTRDVVVGAIENSDVPFERVVRSLRLDNAGGGHPLFRTLFSIEAKPSLPADWSISQQEVLSGAAKMDLYVELDQHVDGSMAGRLTYSADRFDAETIRRMTGHWTTLLESIVAAPETPLRRLAMLDTGEETSLIECARGPERELDDATIHGLVREAATRHPDAPAICFGGEHLTYAELIGRVDTLAAQLRLAGVEAGALVGLCVTRSIDMVVAALAIMSRSAAYLPLDPTFPAARLTAVVDDAEPAAIVTQAVLASQLPGWGLPVVLCDRVPDLAHLRLLPVATDPEALAYVMYTSGSTGVPKGVEIRHRSAVNLLRSMQREPGFSDGDGLLAVTTPTFDISVLEMFLPLISGGVLTVASAEEVVDPEKLGAAIARSRCTVMQATPATWQNLFATGWQGVAGLRVLCGGDALPGELARSILAAGMELWNVYGPTETTIWSSADRIYDPDDVTIGRPIDNTLMLVLDPDGGLQPFNVPGELHIGGAGLARGYRDPALTARAYIETERFGRLYRTGDIARLRCDGRFEWLGRRDGQVKVRGLRIDVGEIEAALAAHPDVAMAAVRTFDDGAGQRSLAAYVVPKGANAPSATRLRDFLRTLLPPYMLPARYATLARMPLSSNGKIDRKALPDPMAGDSPPTPSEPPCGMCEIELAALWMDVLGVDSVGAHDDFQELGGHSLLAARLMAQIERTFGRRLPLSTLLHTPTLRGMAAQLQDTATAPAPVSVVTLQSGSLQPLFWIDAVPNFRPVRYRPLAAALDRDRPLLGLPVDTERHDGLNRTGSLAALAGELADTIRSQGAGEPYLLGGWCNGAILAYEVAAQLTARGAEVGLLVLLDAVNPAAFRKRTTQITAHIQQLWRLPRGQRADFARRALGAHFSSFFQRCQRDRADTAELVDANDRFTRLIAAYRPAPLDVPVLLLQPSDGKIDYASGWREVLGDAIEMVDIAGSNASMLDPPHVAVLGAALERRMALVAEPMTAAAAE